MFQHRQHHYAIKRKKIKQLQEQVTPTKMSCAIDYKLLGCMIKLFAVVCQVTELHA